MAGSHGGCGNLVENSKVGGCVGCAGCVRDFQNILVFDFYRKTEEKSMAEIFEKVLVEVMKAVGKGAAKIIVWTAHQIEKK